MRLCHPRICEIAFKVNSVLRIKTIEVFLLWESERCKKEVEIMRGNIHLAFIV